MKNEVKLPNFKRALTKHAHKLPSGTYWRYSNGKLPPPLGQLLVENPDLAEALAQDARELSNSRGSIVAHEQAAA